MFVGMKKASSQASECEHIIDNVQKENYPIDIRFQPNDVLTDMIQQLKSLGDVANNQLVYTGHNRTSILNMSVKDTQQINVKTESINGCTFMSDGHLVLACFENGLKLFDKNFQFNPSQLFRQETCLLSTTLTS